MDLKSLRDKLLQGAQESFREMEEQFRAYHDTRPEARSKLAAVSFYLAKTFAELGTLPDAIGSCEASIALLEPLVRDHPSVEKYRHDLAGDLNNLGNLQEKTGRLAEAMTSHQRALSHWECMTKDHPDRLSCIRRALRSVKNNIGLVLFDMGRLTEALTCHRRALDIHESRVSAVPAAEAHEAQFDLSESLNNIGLIEQNTGHQTEALETYKRAIQLQEPIVRDHPEVLDYRDKLASCLLNLGATQLELGQLAEALTTHRRELEMWERLVRDHQSVPDYQ